MKSPEGSAVTAKQQGLEENPGHSWALGMTGLQRWAPCPWLESSGCTRAQAHCWGPPGTSPSSRPRHGSTLKARWSSWGQSWVQGRCHWTPAEPQERRQERVCPRAIHVAWSWAGTCCQDRFGVQGHFVLGVFLMPEVLAREAERYVCQNNLGGLVEMWISCIFIHSKIWIPLETLFFFFWMPVEIHSWLHAFWYFILLPFVVT